MDGLYMSLHLISENGIASFILVLMSYFLFLFTDRWIDYVIKQFKIWSNKDIPPSS